MSNGAKFYKMCRNNYDKSQLINPIPRLDNRKIVWTARIRNFSQKMVSSCWPPNISYGGVLLRAQRNVLKPTPFSVLRTISFYILSPYLTFAFPLAVAELCTACANNTDIHTPCANNWLIDAPSSPLLPSIIVNYDPFQMWRKDWRYNYTILSTGRRTEPKKNWKSGKW